MRARMTTAIPATVLLMSILSLDEGPFPEDLEDPFLSHQLLFIGLRPAPDLRSGRSRSGWATSIRRGSRGPSRHPRAPVSGRPGRPCRAPPAVRRFRRGGAAHPNAGAGA